ncbi:DUF423 domain-containing protein [Sphingobium sufflavum]|uniref:DUF423 domain-containing protein n=1 Tax=Sphingobium sufflavum TaxID=1129547 RepID=UPI001F31183F|nr:DUF423 domain-containing protein [Sphingobium sufflavum]MCE7797627.1 DUF423 domain-containing protein [Sphingobium sufflavum]
MLFALAALSAAIAIAAGAFGAHGAEAKAAEYLKTGGLYQMVHAVAIIALGGQMRGPAWLMLVGAAIFAGTLYAMAFGGPRILGAVTPIGGTLMIVGWLWAGWTFTRG